MIFALSYLAMSFLGFIIFTPLVKKIIAAIGAVNGIFLAVICFLNFFTLLVGERNDATEMALHYIANWQITLPLVVCTSLAIRWKKEAEFCLFGFIKLLGKIPTPKMLK